MKLNRVLGDGEAGEGRGHRAPSQFTVKPASCPRIQANGETTFPVVGPLLVWCYCGRWAVSEHRSRDVGGTRASRKNKAWEPFRIRPSGTASPGRDKGVS